MSVIKSQFGSSPIKWMFFSRQTDNMINNYQFHKRGLRIVLNE